MNQLVRQPARHSARASCRSSARASCTSWAALVLTCALSLAAGAAGGCGEDTKAPDLTPFIGTWMPAVAAITTFCDDGNVKTVQVTKPIVMVKSSNADLIDDDASCPVLYDVSGGVARALPGQFCDNPDVITRMHLLDGTFTPQPGAMVMLNASGRLDGYINISVGNTVRCTYDEMGVYRRGAD